MTDMPFIGSAQAFFQPETPDFPQQMTQAKMEQAAQAIAENDRVTCRWCFERFDVELQVRSIRERGYLRTNLFMIDHGREVVCCDACWQGAIGARVLIQGRVVPGDPNAIDNPLLRMTTARTA